jgi:hypothetical protein
MDIEAALREIEGEADLSLKALRLALLLSSLFREVGWEIVVVGGSAIEFYTNGSYMSGDVDVCFYRRGRPPLRVVADVMARVKAESNGGRSFIVAGLFVDILGEAETEARTKFRMVSTGDGSQSVLFAKPEDLLAERVLGSVYPSENEKERECAKKLIAACIFGKVEMDWNEARRVAALPEYRVEKELAELVEEVQRKANSDAS